MNDASGYGVTVKSWLELEPEVSSAAIAKGLKNRLTKRLLFID
jgi:hypothetical protein